MVNVNKLKRILKEKDITFEMLSDRLNLEPSLLIEKLNTDNSYFTIEEADIIVKMLELTAETATDIFFSDCSVNEI